MVNVYQVKLAELPAMKARIGANKVDRLFVELLLLAEELCDEMDGVRCPGAARAILNRFESIVEETE